MTEGNSGELLRQGYEQAVGLMKKCCTDRGFIASLEDRRNYRHIWARDGAILALAALQTGDGDLIGCAREHLLTLAEHQGPHGEIPSNVDPASGRTSYGGTAGRVDANLWFLIACGEYWRATGDESFIDTLLPVLEKVRFLLGAWEFNNRGLLYVPYTGDWADEYIHNGYILFDQLLYLQALRTLAAIEADRGGENSTLREKISRQSRLVRANYWLREDGDDLPEDVYHEVIYRKGQKASCHCQEQYWMPFFTPLGYGYRFDSFANILASLVGIAEPFQQEAVDRHLAKIHGSSKLKLLPAFHPVITPKDEDWEDLQMTFSYTFNNRPYEFQNGGLWPLITGFYVADLAGRGKKERAGEYLLAVHRANSLEYRGRSWSFPEYLHGQTLEPGGTRSLGWSAAAAVIAHHALQGGRIFSVAP